MHRNSQNLSLVMLWLAACSGELRMKPQLGCAPGADLNATECSDGIIGSCAGGSVQYSVCSDIEVCQASWQQVGAYKCSRDNAREDAGLLLYARGSSQGYLQGIALRVTGDTNADGFLTPGEAGTVSIELRNASDEIVRNVTGFLTTSHPGVTITHGAELYFGDLESRQSACGSATADLRGDCGSFASLTKIQTTDGSPIGTIGFQLTVSDAESNSITLSFELIVSATERY